MLDVPSWSEDNLPEMITPLNDIDLIRDERLTMLVWARDPAGIDPNA
jgi:hypothetical protein